MEGTKAPSLQFTGDLLPHLVDKRAAFTPDAIYSEYPVSNLAYDEGYRQITYREFANAINGAAAWLVHTLGPGKDFETLAYMGPNDIRYPALILGAVKAGYKLFLTSPRNSLAAQSALFETLNCRTLLSPDRRSPAITAITDYLDLHIIEVPSVSFGTVMIAPISGAILSGEGLVEILKQAPADVAFLVPSIVQDLAQNTQLLDYCSKHLRAIIYCGGDLPQMLGDIIASKIRLLNQFGASELGLTPTIISLTNRGLGDWKYTQFHPQLGLELRPVSDDVYELYAVRDPEKIDRQPIFTLFPNAQDYASRDLFVRHPSKPDLWSWQARADDIIVFLNSEKTNPISMEHIIVSRNADISAALVVGAQRFQAALLIEPMTTDKALDPAQRAAFIERIWATVEEANKDAPSHARMMKSHVLFTQPQTPMLRAGKGTVQRAGTLKAYASEINALYRDADMISTNLEGEDERQKGILDQATVSDCVRKSVLSTVEWPNFDEAANFFALGMDSLQALVLIRKLRQSLGIAIAPSTLYTNPSVLALTTAILPLLDQKQTSKASQEQVQVKEHNDLVQDLVQEYKTLIGKQLLPKSNVGIDVPSKQEQEIVIPTGSTGTLGSYILDALLQIPTIAHIYCLNRAEDGMSTQIKKNRLLGLQHPPSNKRVSFLTVDLSQSFFNLTESQYDELDSKATIVIHNAWTVNFNLFVSSFKPQLDNLINLLAFANKSARSARFFYVSSISSVISYCSTDGKTTEKPVTADTAPGPNGYSQSKYIAEQIIDYAATTVASGPSFAFARVGQLAGAANHSGIWNKAEWFPSLIISSVQIGAIPDSLGSTFDRIDWVPIDLLADILVELALERGQPAATFTDSETQHAHVYHPLNPHTTTWTAMRAIVLDELSSHMTKPIEIVPLRVWVAKVRKEADAMVDSGGNVSLEAALRRNPAAKLIDFFEDLASSEKVSTNQLEFSETLKLSKAMQGLGPIKDAWVRKWIREWFTPATDHAEHQFM